MAIDNRNPLPDLVPVAPCRTAGADEVLRLDDLHVSVHHGAATAVRGVSLRVRAGEIVGLVGESGSGKTLTCRAALGVLPAGCAVERGTVSFAGVDVTSLSRRDWERLHGSHMGAVFQDPASYLNPVLTVGTSSPRSCGSSWAWAGARRTAARSSCSRRSACASPSGSSTRSRPSCRAACCSG